jgi:hypothetical protein
MMFLKLPGLGLSHMLVCDPYHFKDWQSEDAVILMYTTFFNAYPFSTACIIPKYHSKSKAL